MDIVLSGELSEFVQVRVASGGYASEDAVIREAFRLLKQREELLEHIDEGTRQIRAGQGIELEDDRALERFFEDVKERGRQRAAAGRQAP
jgi:putative addiction module CopG family antidote